MSEKNTNTTEELSTAEIAGVVLARMIVIPVVTLAILALVTLSMFDTFASLPRISNAEFSHFVSTFPNRFTWRYSWSVAFYCSMGISTPMRRSGR